MIHLPQGSVAQQLEYFDLDAPAATLTQSFGNRLLPDGQALMPDLPVTPQSLSKQLPQSATRAPRPRSETPRRTQQPNATPASRPSNGSTTPVRIYRPVASRSEPTPQPSMPLGTDAMTWLGRRRTPDETFIRVTTGGGIDWGFTEKSRDDASDLFVVVMSVAPENTGKFARAVAKWLGVPVPSSMQGLLGILSARASSGTPGANGPVVVNAVTLAEVLQKAKVPFAGGPGDR